MGVGCGNTRRAYEHDTLALLVGVYSPVLFLALFGFQHPRVSPYSVGRFLASQLLSPQFLHDFFTFVLLWLLLLQQMIL
jgi:hypothetical protein